MLRNLLLLPFHWVLKSQTRPAPVWSDRCHCSSCVKNDCLALMISWHPPLTWWPWGDTSAGGWPGWPSRSHSPWCGCCRHTGSGNTPRTPRRRFLKASPPCQRNPERGNNLTWNKKGGWVRGEGNYTLDLFPIKSFAFFPILSTLLLNANGDFLSTKKCLKKSYSPTCWV